MGGTCSAPTPTDERPSLSETLELAWKNVGRFISSSFEIGEMLGSLAFEMTTGSVAPI